MDDINETIIRNNTLEDYIRIALSDDAIRFNWSAAIIIAKKLNYTAKLHRLPPALDLETIMFLKSMAYCISVFACISGGYVMSQLRSLAKMKDVIDHGGKPCYTEQMILHGKQLRMFCQNPTPERLCLAQHNWIILTLFGQYTKELRSLVTTTFGNDIALWRDSTRFGWNLTHSVGNIWRELSLCWVGKIKNVACWHPLSNFIWKFDWEKLCRIFEHVDKHKLCSCYLSLDAECIYRQDTCIDCATRDICEKCFTETDVIVCHTRAAVERILTIMFNQTVGGLIKSATDPSSRVSRFIETQQNNLKLFCDYPSKQTYTKGLFAVCVLEFFDCDKFNMHIMLRRCLGENTIWNPSIKYGWDPKIDGFATKWENDVPPDANEKIKFVTGYCPH